MYADFELNIWLGLDSLHIFDYLQQSGDELLKKNLGLQLTLTFLLDFGSNIYLAATGKNNFSQCV
jgi:hypothetical protein